MKNTFTLYAASLIGILIFSTSSFSEEMKITVNVKKFSKSELEATLIEHSYPLGGTSFDNAKGAFFFQNKRDLLISYKGKKGTGQWTANDNSEFCYTVTLWEGKECITLLSNLSSGGFIHVFDGKNRILKETAIQKGNLVK